MQILLGAWATGSWILKADRRVRVAVSMVWLWVRGPWNHKRSTVFLLSYSWRFLAVGLRSRIFFCLTLDFGRCRLTSEHRLADWATKHGLFTAACPKRSACSKSSPRALLRLVDGWCFTVTCARHPWHPVATDFALANLLLSCLTGLTRLSVTLKKSEKYENMLHIVASCCINSASRSICCTNEQSCGYRGFKLESAKRKNCWLHLAMVKESRISRLDFEVACKVSTCFNCQLFFPTHLWGTPLCKLQYVSICELLFDTICIQYMYMIYTVCIIIYIYGNIDLMLHSWPWISTVHTVLRPIACTAAFPVESSSGILKCWAMLKQRRGRQKSPVMMGIVCGHWWKIKKYEFTHKYRYLVLKYEAIHFRVLVVLLT